MSINKNLQEQAEANRKNLAKQDAWAHDMEAKNVTWMKSLTIEEFAYGSGDRQKLDLIYRNKQDRKPLLIYIHGGGYVAGQKEARRNYCGIYASQGFAVANIEYTLAPEAPYPTAIGEIAQAIDWVLDKAAEYNIDVGHIAVGGESAGGYYAMYAALLAKDKYLLERLGFEPMHHSEYDVKACILNCPCTHLKLTALSGFPEAELFMNAYVNLSMDDIKKGNCNDVLDEKSPLTYVEDNFSPTFLIYGQFDKLRNNALALAERFKEKHVRHTLYKGTGIFYGQHTTHMIFKGKKAFKCFEQVMELIL